jgi:hypothetical protein
MIRPDLLMMGVVLVAFGGGLRLQRKSTYCERFWKSGYQNHES